MAPLRGAAVAGRATSAFLTATQRPPWAPRPASRAGWAPSRAPPPRAPGPRVRGAGAPGAAHLPSSFSPRYGSGSASAGGRPEGCAASRGRSDPDGRVPPDSAGGLPARPGLCPSQQAMRERELRRRWRFLRVGAAGGSHHLCLHPTGQGQSHDHTQLQGDPGVPLSRARRRKGSRSGGRRPVSARAPAAGRQVPAPFPHCPSRVPEGAPEPRAAPGCGSPVGIPGRCALFSVPPRGPASWCRDDELKREKRFPPPQRPRFQRWGRGGVAAQRLHDRGAGREAQGGPGVRAAMAASAGGDGPEQAREPSPAAFGPLSEGKSRLSVSTVPGLLLVLVLHGNFRAVAGAPPSFRGANSLRCSPLAA